MILDAHNHLHQVPDPAAAIALMRRSGILGCVVNGTSENDWPQVAALARSHPDFVLPSFGLHPWYAHHRTSGWFDSLRRHLDLFPHAVIGECGLDRWVAEPALETQRAVFLPQLRLARERSLPLTLHVLKAWDALFSAFEEEPPPATGFLLHSFGGSAETAARAARLGARFSFSGYFLHARKASLIPVFQGLPRDRIMLETDAPAMTPPPEFITHPMEDAANHPANLPSIARGFAGAMGIDFHELLRDCLQNARAFFDPTHQVFPS
ncbi:MAG: TatD family hydrolase [Akkermansiaceae bacterium]|jgi:TatD DNase family protein|nr:TatD family hydrolase [Akkermansiaceae bacterium]